MSRRRDIEGWVRGHGVFMQEARGSLAARLVRNVPGAIRDGSLGAIKFAVIVVAAMAVAFGSAILVFAWVDPPGSLLMVRDRLVNGGHIDSRWIPLDAVSPNLIRAVIASEDSAFCGHRGVDFAELQQALEAAERRGGDVRGASTITMQVAKNLLLWPSRSYLRKGFEIPLALAIDRVWSKRRTIEIYLNIVEWGPGIYGIEAASRRYFRKPPSRLTPGEAALLAVALPAPRVRNASRPHPRMLKLAQNIEERVRNSTRALRCLGSATEDARKQ